MTALGRTTRTVLAAAVLAAASPALAQQSRTPIAPLRIIDYGGDLYVRGDVRRETETVSGSSTSTNERDSFFEEGLDLRGAGYVYHPNLLDWDASVQLGLNQERITIDENSRNTRGTLSGYSFTGVVLKEKPVSLRLFASQRSSVLARDFTQHTDLTSRRTGFEVFSKGTVPMGLLVERSSLDETGFPRENRKTTDYLRYRITDQRNENRVTTLTYEHEDTDETSTFFAQEGGPGTKQPLPVRRDEANVSALWRFGPEKHPHSFSGRLRALDRRGFFPDRVLTADGQIDLAHTETFSTFHHFFYNRDQTTEQLDRTTTGEVGFRKSIYDSLDITGRTIATQHTFEDGSEDMIGAFLEMQYRKQTPIGVYNASVLLGKEKEKEQSGGAPRTVLGRQVTLAGGTYSSLGEAGIIPSSVVVMNQARTIQYVEGPDYTLRQTGEFVEIARTLGTTTILDGQTVLVDYQVRTARSAEFTTDHVNWLNRLDLACMPLALYANLRLRDERLQSGEDPGNLDLDKSHVVGIELDYEGLTIALEHQETTRRLFPSSEADRVIARYHRSLGRNVSLSAGGQAERLKYLDAETFGLEPGRDVLDSFRAFGHLSIKVRHNSLVRLAVEHNQSRGRENNELTRFQISWEWTYRDLDFSVEARHNIFQQERNEGTSDAITFNLIRRF